MHKSLEIVNILLLLLPLSHFSRVRLCASPRRQPTRLPRPWDSPGKNTGVGCHFLLQCMKVKSESKVTQSHPTLSDTMDCSPPGSFIHGIFQARVLQWGAIAFFKVISDQISRSVVLTLSDPMDCSLLGSSTHGIFQARVLEWGAIAFSRMNMFIASPAS